MRYFGGKQRIALKLTKFINENFLKGNTKQFVDLFCGSCNVMTGIDDKRIRMANDKHKYLISMWSELQNGWIPPKDITEEDYKHIRENKNENTALAGFVGFGCSYSGKWWGGYARGQGDRNYCLNAYNSTMKKLKNLMDVKFFNEDYFNVPIPQGAVVYCFDKDTEVLTNNGWKFFKDVNIKEDLFLSREPNTKRIEYVDAIRYVNYNYKGKMYVYENKNIDICVTDEHNIFGSRLRGRNKQREEFLMNATDFHNKSNERTFIRAGGLWEGSHFDTIEIAGESFNSLLFARLLGIFLADGSVNNQGAITITQTKETVIKKIIYLLDTLNIEYSHYEPKAPRTSHTFYINRKYLPFFKQFYLKKNRCIPNEFKNASVEIMKELIDGILDGDGDTERRKIITGSLSLVNDIQECLYKIGKASNYYVQPPKTSYLKSEGRHIVAKGDYYVISLLNTEYPKQHKQNVRWVDYDDEVFCVTLSKWHTVLTRRNGKTIWLGQCDIPYKNTAQYSKKEVGKFDHDKFYDWVRENKNKYTILISEYKHNVPEDFEVIFEVKSKQDIRSKDGKQKETEEVLMMIKGDI